MPTFAKPAPMGLGAWIGLGLIAADLARAARARRGSLADAPQLGAPTRRMHRVGGIDSRVKHIQALARKGGTDAVVRQRVMHVLNKKCGDGWCVPERDWEGEARALFDFVRANVRYMRDHSKHDTYTSASRTLVDFHGGDCDDGSIALAAMLLAAGHTPKLRVVQTRGYDTWNHIYVVTGLPPAKPTRWMALDASVAQPAGWEVPHEQIIKKKDYTL